MKGCAASLTRCWPGLVSRTIRSRRLGARLILQQALEDEVTDFVGRACYERAGGGWSMATGSRRRTRC